MAGMLALLGKVDGSIHLPQPILVWLIPLLPIFGFLFQVFVGRNLPKFLVSLVSCGLVLISAMLSSGVHAN